MVAAVYKGKRIIGTGYNAYPSRRAGETYDPAYAGIGVHAELEALSLYDVRGSTLYLAGVKQTGYEITSKPCARCNNLLINSTVKSIVYLDAEQGIVKVSVRDLILMDIPPYNYN